MIQHEVNLTFESGEGFKALFQYATIGIIVVDPNGHIVIANPYAEKLFGYEESELDGQSIEMLIPDDLRDGHRQKRNVYNQHPVSRRMGSDLELFALKKDGTIFPVEISLSNYRQNDVEWIMAFVNDISERKKAEAIEKNYAAELEEKIRERTADLSASLDREMALNEMKSRFVSLASHEFRTPLSTILTSISLIDRYRDPVHVTKRDKHVSRIKSSVRMMTNILNDFLSLDQINQGKVATEPELFSMHTLIREVVDDLDQMRKPDQEVRINFQGESRVWLNQKLVRNILVNLTSNAIKYTPEGRNVTVGSKIESRYIELTVADEGIGIPAEDQKNLFQMFFRAGNVGVIRGTGLGLNIVKKFVELLNGTIECYSREGVGTTFTVRIPHQSQVFGDLQD